MHHHATQGEMLATFYDSGAARCRNLRRGIIPCDVNNCTTSASLVVMTSSSGSSPRTKLTRQSAQSGVPRRTQSLQLIDSSMSLVISHLSRPSTLVRVCDITDA